MTQEKRIGSVGFLQEALINDKDFLRTMVEKLCQGLMEEEITDFLQADSYERCEERQGYRNGYKPRVLHTRVGDLMLAVPKDREGNFSTKLFERYQRSEKALVLSIIEMYIQGVSTRKVSKIAEELCGHSVSKSQVSRLASELDQELLAFRHRPLGVYPYLVIDARYEKIRTKRGVVSQGVLIIAGINAQGYREILSVEVKNTENETNWAEVFRSLKRRGLSGVEFAVSDNHSGLVRALEQEFTGVIWQRCQCHSMKNLLDKVAKKDKAALKAEIRAIFDSPALERARELLSAAIEHYESRYPAVSDLLDESQDSLLACFALPEGHRRRLRTTNLLERYNQEIKRRTKVVRIFPNEDAALRLITALAAEQTEEWSTGRKYLDMQSRDDAKMEIKPEANLVLV
jgi:transposase-like protein